ncbi:MAG TPA: xanthine dehydrogenase family protein molybdopterin-binding subunit [Candidatus Limnocylindrales bacterium]|nr:xanthine dehydrogenase family protein molybdopterin-binding subunit [Candidatus Limnocylindrales bacterium]
MAEGLARYVGRSVPRVEDERLVRGRGRYVDDIDLPGQLHGAFLRSVLANARIRSIDATAAREAPGVRLVLTGADLGELNAPLPPFVPDPNMRNPRTQLPLAVDRVRYVGEAIAFVVAADRYLAEDAAALIEVDYEPLPAVVDLATATAAEGRVHDEVPDNVAGDVHDSTGDPDAVFAAAPFVERVHVSIERSTASPIEGRGINAAWDPDAGRLTMYASTQAPVPLKGGLSRLLGLDPDRVHVEAPDVGGGFGSKIMVFYPEEIVVPYAATRVGAPVKWTEDRWEYFVAANQERRQIHDAEIAFDAEGTILGVRTRFLHDGGAYTPYGSDVTHNTATHVLGQYRIPAFEISGQVVFTNKVPVSPYRGAGRPQAVFVMERLVGAMARRLGRDPNEIRRRNLIPKDAFPYETGLHIKAPVTYDSGNYEEAFDEALELVEARTFRSEQAAAREAGRYLGLGVAPYIEATAPARNEACGARLDEGGRLVLAMGLASQGQGHETVFAQIAADTLGCGFEDVAVRTGNTAGEDAGIGTFGSRGVVMGGNAVALAVRELREQLVRFAADLFEATPADIGIADGWVSVAGSPQRRLRIATLVALAGSGGADATAEPGDDPATFEAARRRAAVQGGPTTFEAHGQADLPAMTFASGVHAAIVEVDPGTGGVRILRYVLVHDCGRIVNPTIVEGQVLGGLAQGIGGALLERLVFDEDGQPQTTSFMDFRLPTVDDIPEVRLAHFETPSTLNPLGVKGTGEAGVIPVSAVIAEAIEDALAPFAVRVDSMPLFPDEIVGLIERARQATAA